MAYPINSLNSYWNLYKAWLDSQNLVEGVDYTRAPSIPGWSTIYIENEQTYNRFVLYGGTIDYQIPVISSQPLDNSSNISNAADIIFTFREDIFRGNGVIEMRRDSNDGSLVEQFNISASDRIAISGSSLTIDPVSNLIDGVRYFFSLPAGVVKGLGGNGNARVTEYDFLTGPQTTSLRLALSINEDELQSDGVSISEIIQTSNLLGLNGQTSTAIAIEKLDLNLGSWQYKVSGSSEWRTIESDLLNRDTGSLAILLRSQDSVRLVPFSDLNGTQLGAITFRSWDSTNGSSGQYQLTTAGTNGFGTTTSNLDIEVVSVNDTPTFANSNGRAIVGFDIGDESIYSLTQQHDGRIIIVGETDAGPGSHISVTRLNLDGSLDEGFGERGKALIAVELNKENRGHSVAVQADGKIIVGGFSGDGSARGYSITRLTSTGDLDLSFGTGGVVKTYIGNGADDGILSIRLQPDGKILASGWSETENFGAWKPSIARYNTNGTLDSGFDLDGKKILQTSSSDEGGVLVIRDDGKIVVTGQNSSSATVVRLNADGSYDSTLDGDGRLTLPFQPAVLFSSEVQPDGKIVSVGAIYSDGNWHVAVQRLLDSGQPDPTFGSGGRKLLDWGNGDDFGQSVAIQSDGKILVGGFSKPTSSPSTPFDGGKYATQFMTGATIGVMRLNSDGTLDSSFSQDGRHSIQMGESSFAYDLIAQPDSKIVVAGSSISNGRETFSLIRLNPDGSDDPSFGSNYLSSLDQYPTYIENGEPVLLDSSVRVRDAELATQNGNQGNYGGSRLQISRISLSNPDDKFSLGSNFELSGNLIFRNSLEIASHTQTNGTLNINFNSNTDQVIIDDLLSSVHYSNLSDAPQETVTLEWKFYDGNQGEQGLGGELFGSGVTQVKVFQINDRPSGAVTISGRAVIGETLTASSTIMDPDGIPSSGTGAIGFQWKLDGVDVPGATSNSLVLLSGFAGKSVSVVASYTDLTGTRETVASATTDPIPSIGGASVYPAYHWKSHMLLSEVQVGSMSAHAGAADSSLFDLRAAAFDAATSTLTVQVWSTPASASANFDFRVSSTGVTSASFTSALGSGWTVLPNMADPAAISVSGFDGNLTGFATATQLGTLTLQYAAGTTAMSALFSGLNVGDQSATDLNLSVMGQVTDSDGLFNLPDDGPATTAIKVSRSTNDTGNAVTSADALAALRMAVEINPNADPDGAGPLQPLRTSPYQFMAADANGSGTVTSADALAILRMAVKLADALPNEWFFVEETRDFWNEVTQQYTLTRTAAAWDRSVVIDASASPAVGVVGVLKGDVNGSWSAPTGSVDLDTLDPNYFTSLATRMAVPTDQWGV